MDFNERKPFQFNLWAALVTTTMVCIFVAMAGVAPRLTASLLPIVSAVTVIFSTLILVERRLSLHKPPGPAPIGSCILISASAWTIMFVMLGIFIQIPGISGPQQYSAGDPFASFVFGLRVGTIIVMLGAPVVSILVGVSRIHSGIRVRVAWLTAAIALYIAAWIMLFCHPEIFPMV